MASASASGVPPTPLFGGAMSATLPAGWDDCSEMRPVPDHQEVYMERAGGARSLIIEILEYAEVPDEQCASYHFVDVAESNGATEHSIADSDSKLLSTTALQPSLAQACAQCYALRGLQKLPAAEAVPGDSSPPAPQQLELAMAVVRLPKHRTDLLVSVNRGRPLPPTTSAASEEQLADAQADAALLAAVVGSLAVHEWGLFGEEPDESPG